MAALAAPLAVGINRATLRAAGAADSRDPAGDDETETGLLVLPTDGSVEMANRAADRWLGELGAGDRGGLPVVVHAIASRAREVATGNGDNDGMARAQVRTASGRWASLEGSLLGNGPEPRVAVLLEPVRPPELAPLIADAYGLTVRECRVTELVARGFSTNEIAGRLHLRRTPCRTT